MDVLGGERGLRVYLTGRVWHLSHVQNIHGTSQCNSCMYGIRHHHCTHLH